MFLGCEGRELERDIAYPYNDLKVESKSSMEECQAFCKADRRCFGWDFNTKSHAKPGVCAIKSQRTGRIKANGSVSGHRDACVTGTIKEKNPDLNGLYF